MSEQRHPQHETTDANVHVVAWAAISLAAMIVLVLAGVWWVYKYVRAQDQVRDVRRTLVPPAPPVPPQPRIQVNPQEDFQAYKREQERILTSYGWISRDDGRVRIPIDRAMDLLVQRGLPARPANTETKR